MASKFSNGYALLIGAGRDTDLPFAITDAKALHKLLTDPDRAAYPPDQSHLIYEKDANSSGILAEFDKLIEQVNKDENSTVLIYYSGHGGFLKNGDKKNYYLFPYGYDVNDTSTLVDANDLAAKVDALKTKKLIILIDSCYSAGMLSDKDEEGGMDAKGEGPDLGMENSTSPLIRKMAGGTGRVIVASCQDDQVSWGKKPHSVFTETMLEAMTGVNSSPFGNTVHVLDVLQHTFNRVPHRTRKTRQPQKPVINEIKDLNSDFFLCQFNASAANEMRSKGIGDQQTAMQSPKEKMEVVKNYKQVVTITQNIDNSVDNSSKIDSKKGDQSGGIDIGTGHTFSGPVTINMGSPAADAGGGGGSKSSGNSAGSGNSGEITLEKLKDALAKNADRNIGKILDRLVDLAENEYPDYHNDTIMIKSTYSRWKNNQMMTDANQNNIEFNRINHRLLQLFDDMGDDGDIF
jgi:hypothetical protein